MRLLITGSNDINAIENYYCKHLADETIKIKRIPSASFYERYYHRSIMNKLLVRCGISSIFYNINKKIQTEIIHFRPNVIMVFKGMEISKKTLFLAKKLGAITVNYNPDSPYVFVSYGNGKKAISKNLKLYDYHFTYNYEILEKLNKDGYQAFLLPFASESIGFNEINLSESEEIKRVCFYGGPDNLRYSFLNSLAKLGHQIDIFGDGWSRRRLHKNIQLSPSQNGFSLRNIIAKYRVQLNILSLHNLNSHNMRSFEIPGNHGIQLAPKSRDHEFYFAENKTIILYHSIHDCSEQIERLLKLPFDEIMKMRKQSFVSIVNQHTYLHRSLFLKEKFIDFIK